MCSSKLMLSFNVVEKNERLYSIRVPHFDKKKICGTVHQKQNLVIAGAPTSDWREKRAGRRQLYGAHVSTNYVLTIPLE